MAGKPTLPPYGGDTEPFDLTYCATIEDDAAILTTKDGLNGVVVILENKATGETTTIDATRRTAAEDDTFSITISNVGSDPSRAKVSLLNKKTGKRITIDHFPGQETPEGTKWLDKELLVRIGLVLVTVIMTGITNYILFSYVL